ncbi:DNA translocase FtsK, partial [Microvirga sp. Mcv34]|uniref:DNA translocase FtsK n=1 Tax=Microvirga sp. Mcv34 TaxID=2926016 RepID=UPI0021CA186F
MQFAWQAPWSSVGEAQPGWWPAFELSKDVRATRTPDRFIKKQIDTNVVALIAEEGIEVAHAARQEDQAAQDAIHNRIERLRAAIEARSTDAHVFETTLDSRPAVAVPANEQSEEEATYVSHDPVADDLEPTLDNEPVLESFYADVSLENGSEETVIDTTAEESAERRTFETEPSASVELLLPVPVSAVSPLFSGFAFQSSLYKVVLAAGSFLIDDTPMEAESFDRGTFAGEAAYDAHEFEWAAAPEESGLSSQEPEEMVASDIAEPGFGDAVVHDAADGIDLGYLSLFGDEFATAEMASEAPVADECQETSADPVVDFVMEKVSLPMSGQAAQVIEFPMSERAFSEPRKCVGYELPSIELLAPPPPREGEVLTEDILEERAGRVEKVIRDFGVKGEVIHVHPGPVVTLYELEPAPGVKSSRVIALSEDIARSMSAVSARVAVIPGRNAIGIELPNATRETVYLREMLEAADFQGSVQKLPICLGKTIGGEPVIADLARMPHLLVAGTTG